MIKDLQAIAATLEGYAHKTEPVNTKDPKIREKWGACQYLREATVHVLQAIQALEALPKEESHD